MPKYIATICAVLVSCFGLYFLIHGFGDARYRQGISDTISAQSKSDSIAIITNSQIMADAFQQTQDSLKTLPVDGSSPPAVISTTVDRLYERRKNSAVPVPNPRPTR